MHTIGGTKFETIPSGARRRGGFADTWRPDAPGASPHGNLQATKRPSRTAVVPTLGSRVGMISTQRS